jgi:ATP-binding cassette, subfamily B, bacterial
MSIKKNIKQRFPYYHQLDGKDCGPACLKMIAAFHGRKFSIQYLRDHAHISRLGVSLLGISDAAEKMGMGKYPGAIVQSTD